MKLFIPAVGYRIRLTQDWSFELYHESRNDTLTRLIDPTFNPADHRGRYVERGEKLRSQPTSMPTGTLLEVDRVYVRTINKAAQSPDDDYDSVTFKVLEHPTLGSPKKVRFWTKLVDVNNIEYELPADHTAGKDKAKENAKKPKKLTPDRIRELVSNAMHAVNSPGRPSYWGPVPEWMTKDAIKQFKAVATERARLIDPWDKARFEAQQLKERADLEHKLKSGQLTVPIAYADKIKTIEDLRTYQFGWERLFKAWEPPAAHRGVWSYVITHHVMRSHGERSQTHERMHDGTHCRTFRASSPQKYGWNDDEPGCEHLWVKVLTNADDLEIIRIEAGFDQPVES